MEINEARAHHKSRSGGHSLLSFDDVDDSTQLAVSSALLLLILAGPPFNTHGVGSVTRVECKMVL